MLCLRKTGHDSPKTGHVLEIPVFEIDKKNSKIISDTKVLVDFFDKIENYQGNKFLENFEWLRYIKNKKYNFWRFDTFFSKTKYRNVKIIENGGWHFSKVKNEKDIYPMWTSSMGQYWGMLVQFAPFGR